MVEQLEAIFDRVERAQEHLESIKGELLSYYNSDPCRLRGEFQPKAHRSGEAQGPGGELASLNVRLNTLIGEFLHDLRSALNHLARELVTANGLTPTESSQFRVFGKEPCSQRKQALLNINPGIGPEARTLITDAQPYKLGDRYSEHPLWVLHELWNIDKHREVIARGGVPFLHFVGDLPAFSYTSRLESATAYGAKLILVPDDPDLEANAYGTFQVTLHEPHAGIEDPPLLETFDAILKTVLGLVNAAEDRCF
jgi:hypothetical protein